MNKENKLISICVFTFNHEKYIEECIQSILNQETKYSIEILVFDDCSHDNTVEIIKDKFKNLVKVYCNDVNQGYCANLHRALTCVQGDYFFSLAGDDRFSHAYVVERLISVLEEHPEYISVTGWNKIINSKGEYTGEHVNRNSVYSFKEYLEGITPWCYEGFIRVFWRDKIDESDILLRGARNNEEIPFWSWVLSKGDKYIMQDYMIDYRFVQEENGTNYNSITTAVKAYRDNYQNIKMLEEETRFYYKGMLIVRTYNEITEAIVKLDIKRIIEILFSLKVRDLFMCIINIPLYYFSGKRLPKWMESKIERCSGHAYRKNTF